MNQHFDCIIIGAGVAGLSAAIYLKRANKNILLIEKYIPGGQINKSSIVENYPGYTNIDGPSLVMNIVDQINSMEIPLIYEEVKNINKNNHFSIETNKNNYTSDNVILATGRTANKLGIPDENYYVGKGISYCALCDGNLYKNKDVIVIGGGNSAIEESIYLSNICNTVTVLNRSSNLRADQILQDRIKNISNITIKYNSEIKNINEKENRIVSVTTNNGKIYCDGIFVYIGLTPEIDYLNNLDIKKEKNYIIVDNNMKTNIEGLYACGDSIKKNVYQIITAGAEGAIAAMSAIKNI